MSKLLQMIEDDEDYRKHVYNDSHGNATIGIGFNLNAGISKNLALHIAKFQIAEIQETLSYKFPFWNKLSRTRQDVLVNLAFNLGINGLLKFKKMLAAIEEEDWARAKYELLDSAAARELHNRYHRLGEMLLIG
jgi:lysozyme